MGRFAVVLAVAGSLVGAAGAEAATYAGKSNDGTRVTLKTESSGVPKKVLFGNYKANCNRGYTFVRNPITGFIPPFTSATADELLDKGHLKGRRRHLDGAGTVRPRGSYRFEAEHTPEDTWKGHYRTEIRFQKHGRTVTRCAARFGFNLPLK